MSRKHRKAVQTIVYHGDCPDGFCAAFVAQDGGTARLVPATYGTPIEDAAIFGQHVLVVDFSWPREQTLYLAGKAASMVVLDHHKTAEAELAGLPFCTFDMERSGAQLAWDYCRSGPRPWYVEYVADRDLWRWKLPESKVVSAFLMALPHTVEAWRQLDGMTAQEAFVLGRGARAQVEHYVEKVTAQAYPGNWNGQPLRVVNAAYPNISDVCHELCTGDAIGVGWFVRGDGMMQFSLRSIGEVDVSALAKTHGGGGHRNAAGFQLPFTEGLRLLESWAAL